MWFFLGLEEYSRRNWYYLYLIVDVKFVFYVIVKVEKLFELEVLMDILLGE